LRIVEFGVLRIPAWVDMIVGKTANVYRRIATLKRWAETITAECRTSAIEGSAVLAVHSFAMTVSAFPGRALGSSAEFTAGGVIRATALPLARIFIGTQCLIWLDYYALGHEVKFLQRLVRAADWSLARERQPQYSFPPNP
jgi:hypothetical protein